MIDSSDNSEVSDYSIENVLVIDTETTQGDPEDSRIRMTQVAVVHCMEAESKSLRTIRGSWSSYMNPGKESLDAMPPDVVSITGLTPSFLTNKGRDPKDVMTELNDHIKKDGIVLAAHNWPFDKAVISNEYKIHGRLMPDHPFIDTLRVAREIYDQGDWTPEDSSILPNFQLGTCFYGVIPREEWDVIDGSSHDAVFDATMCARLIEHWYSAGMSISDMIDISWRPFVPRKVPFGKHKGSNWSDLPVDYVEWMLSKKVWFREDGSHDEGLEEAIYDAAEALGIIKLP